MSLFAATWTSVLTRCRSLIKDEKARPVPEDLLAHPFIVKGAQASVDVGAWTSQYRLKSFVQYEAFL